MRIKLKPYFIPMNLKRFTPEECVGKVFKIENGVFSCLTDIEDIVKSQGHFGAHPQHLYLCDPKAPKCEGDPYIHQSFGSTMLYNKASKQDAEMWAKGFTYGEKIMATTDPDLIALGVPSISTTYFIKEWVNALRNGTPHTIEMDMEEVRSSVEEFELVSCGEETVKLDCTPGYYTPELDGKGQAFLYVKRNQTIDETQV